MCHLRHFSSLAALAVAIGAPVAAYAQSTQTAQNGASADPADRASQATVGDIIVTARKRVERLQDVPISISAVTRDTITARNNLRIDELAATIPNVTVSAGPLSVITVRGISSQTRYNPGFDSGVGVYIDGVVQGKLYTFDAPLYDVDRVEFLRGPQGTLFGKNSVAGAISIVTRNPTFKPVVDADIQYGSQNLRRTEGFASAPLTQTVAVSVGGFVQKRDGYVLNLFDGRRFGNDDAYGGRAKLLWKPSDRTQIVIAGDYLRENNLAYVPEITTGYGAPTGRYQTNVDFPTLAYRKVYGVQMNADFETDFGATLTSITAYRWGETHRSSDTDAGPAPVVVSASNSFQKQFSQELRLAGKVGERLTYLLGGYLFRQDTDNDSVSTFGTITNVPSFLRGLTGNTFGQINTDSVAAFGSVDWRPVSKLTLTAGLRYTNESKDLEYQQIGFPFIAPSLAREHDRIESNDLSPTFTVRYEPNRTLMLYATASRGFKSGGWNVDNITSLTITSFKQLRFGDENVWNYEAGIKSQFLDNAVTFNVSGFYERYSNIQTPQLTPVLGGGGAVVSIVTNAGTAEIKGIEGELSAKPFKQLTLSASAGYTDAHYTNYVDSGVSFSGNRLPGAPPFNMNLSGTLRQPVVRDWSLGLRGEFIHVAGMFGDRENTALRRTPALDTVNASVGVYGRSFDLVFFANNLLDDESVTFTSSGGFAFSGIGTNTSISRRVGRTIGIRLGARFGR